MEAIGGVNCFYDQNYYASTFWVESSKFWSDFGRYLCSECEQNLNKINSACYIKFFADIVNGIFESFGGQLLFRSEFFLHCWIAEGFLLYFLHDCDQKNNFSRIPNTMWAEFLMWVDDSQFDFRFLMTQFCYCLLKEGSSSRDWCQAKNVSQLFQIKGGFAKRKCIFV